MIDRLQANGPPERPPASRRAERTDASAFAAIDSSAPNDVPATPPPEVLHALDRAQSVLAELASRQVSMHISVDEQTSRVHVELRDAEDADREVLPHAVRMLAGDFARVPAVDATGQMSSLTSYQRRRLVSPTRPIIAQLMGRAAAAAAPSSRGGSRRRRTAGRRAARPRHLGDTQSVSSTMRFGCRRAHAAGAAGTA
jgi:hypothetical protein